MGKGVHPAELASLIQQHAAALELFAAQWTRFPADAVQEAFISLAAERPVPTHPRAWLYKVVRFKAIDQARAESRRKIHEGSCAEQRSEWFIPGKECSLEMDETVAALKTLPVEQRETIVARLWGGLSFREIAELTETSHATCHRRYQDGIEALRNQLESPCRTNERILNSD